MILFLDTSDPNSLHFAIYDLEKEKLKEKIYKVSYEDSRKALNYLSKFLGKDKSKLSKIYVVSGPGSFTGVRIGLAISLGLSTAFNIPVLALKKDEVPSKIEDLFKSKKIPLKKVTSNFDPFYGAEPNITMSKKNAK
jgi:hypothetical protein